MSGSFRPERAERPTFLPEAAAFLPDLRHPRRFCPAGLGDKDGRPAPPPMIRTGRRAGRRQLLEPKFLRFDQLSLHAGPQPDPPTGPPTTVVSGKSGSDRV